MTITKGQLEKTGFVGRPLRGRFLVNTTAGELWYVGENQVQALRLTNVTPAGETLVYVAEMNGHIMFKNTLTLDYLMVGEFKKFDFEKI